MRPVTVNRHLRSYERDSYATEPVSTQDSTLSIVDCALGVNPYGPPPGLTFPAVETLGAYAPPQLDLREALANRWSEVADITTPAIKLEAGTFGVIERLSKLFLEPGVSVLGYAPQFSDFVHEVRQRGAHYEYVALRAQDDFRFSPEELAAAIRPEHRLVYIDNPNNPTGQILTPEAIAPVVERAADLGVAVLIDEAYGDFAADDQSSVALTTRFDNVVVARSFSKGWGLAGARVGYAILSSELLGEWEKVEHPFPVSAPAQHLALQTLAHPGYMDECRARVTQHKSSLIHASAGLSVMATSPTIPILTLLHPDPEVNLQLEYARHGVLVSGGNHFDELGTQAVRIRIPREIERLIEATSEIVASLS